MNRSESNNFNNTRSNAEIMEVGDTFTGKLDTLNDVDCIKIKFPYRGWVKFELDIPSDTDYRIRVFKNDDDNYATQDIRLGDLGQMRACSAFVDNTSDVYYICISVNYSNKFNASANYTLRVFYVDNTSVTSFIKNVIDKFGINQKYEVNASGNKYWNKGNTSNEDTLAGWGLTTSSNGVDTYYGNARQCAGFSFFIANKLFGEHPYINNSSQVVVPDGWIKITDNYSNIRLKAGDIIRKKGHSAVVYDVTTSDTGELMVNVLECLGSVSSLVRYGGFNGKTRPQTMKSMLLSEATNKIEYIIIVPER